MPDLPTVAEAGVPGFEATAWFMLLAPAKTSTAIVARVHRDTVAVLNKTDLKERFAKQGAEVVGNTSAQSLDYLKAEITRWGKVVTEANIRPE